MIAKTVYPVLEQHGVKAQMRRYKPCEQRDRCYDFPIGHLGPLRTIIPVKSTFEVPWLRIHLANQYKGVDSVRAVICTMLMATEQNFRRFQASELQRR